MLKKWQVQAVISVAAVVWAAMLLAQGTSLRVSFLRPYSAAVGAGVVALVAYDRWLWRWSLVRRLSHLPVLRGTWRGTLTSTWKDRASGKAISPIPVFLAVRQTASEVWLSLLTA